MDLFNFKLLKTKYFWIAVVIIGTAGIWLPVLLSLLLGEPIQTDEIPINLTTFYISIYFAGCVDTIFRNIDLLENKYELKSKLVSIIGLILLFILLIIATIWLKIEKHFVIPLILSLIGSLIGLKLWWDNYQEEPTYSEFIRGESKEKHGKKWK
ncbi:hypothetical protein PW52_00430 [Tamlana sedimentorum]|uniref:Uncharacterized protein n=1 Tax=Neotamlana sedimentorum TaxID=1435349 RepID=A0A0D7WCX1_9FLAO|nr:hypothetical protein [Tamlana sedimentorum]KJD36961.1 hypothetical protein PW52_00430 [Tamlana sedimentorum]